MNHVELQAVNATEAESSSYFKAGAWNCIFKPPLAISHHYSYILGDDQPDTQQIQFNEPILHQTSPIDF